MVGGVRFGKKQVTQMADIFANQVHVSTAEHQNEDEKKQKSNTATSFTFFDVFDRFVFGHRFSIENRLMLTNMNRVIYIEQEGDTDHWSKLI